MPEIVSTDGSTVRPIPNTSISLNYINSQRAFISKSSTSIRHSRNHALDTVPIMKTCFNSQCQYSTLRQCKAHTANWSYCIILPCGILCQDASSSTVQHWCSSQTPTPCTQSPLGTSGICQNPEVYAPHPPPRAKQGIWVARMGDSMGTGLLGTESDAADEQVVGRRPWPQDREQRKPLWEPPVFSHSKTGFRRVCKLLA